MNCRLYDVVHKDPERGLASPIRTVIYKACNVVATKPCLNFMACIPRYEGDVLSSGLHFNAIHADDAESGESEPRAGN